MYVTKTYVLGFDSIIIKNQNLVLDFEFPKSNWSMYNVFKVVCWFFPKLLSLADLGSRKGYLMWCFRLDKGVIDAVFVVAFALLCDDIASMMLLYVCVMWCV